MHRSLASLVLLSLLASTAYAQRVTPLQNDTVLRGDAGCFAVRCFIGIGDFDGNSAAVFNTGEGVAVVVRNPPGPWIVQQAMQNPDERINYYEPIPFGAPIALQGDSLFVTGTSRRYNMKNMVYVWARTGTTWTHVQTLAPPRPAGFSDTQIRDIAIYGNTAAISGVRVGSGTGAVLSQIDIYARQPDGRFLRRAQINPPTGQASEDGYPLALEGNRLLVGDPNAGTGRVYVYEFSTSSGWVLRNQLQAADGSAGSGFGSALALAGGTIAIGAPRRPNFDNPLHLGAVYTFQRTAQGWAQTQLIVKPEYEVQDDLDPSEFGRSLDITADRLLIQWSNVFLMPLAYLYERRGVWAPVASMNYDPFLYSGDVFLSGDSALIHAGDSTGNTGATYDLPPVWTLPPRVDEP